MQILVVAITLFIRASLRQPSLKSCPNFEQELLLNVSIRQRCHRSVGSIGIMRSPFKDFESWSDAVGL